MMRLLNTGKRVLSATLMVTLLTSTFAYGFLHAPRTAHAALPVIDPANLKANIVSAVENTVSAIAESVDMTKEQLMDSIIRWLVLSILRSITASTIDWINSGFEGSPAFILDMERHLLNAFDEVAGELIYGSELGFLCSPFALDIRVALALQYDFDYGDFDEANCKLSDVLGNVEDFYAGTFEEGGWQRWFDISISPENNPYGAYVMAETELGVRLRTTEKNARDEALWSSGFLSKRNCLIGDEGSGCHIVFPGKAIIESLSFDLTIGKRTLIEADEIGEMIGAVLAALGNQAMIGAAGLLGLSQRGLDGSSYTDRLRNEGQTFNAENVDTVTVSMKSDEDRFIAVHQRVVDEVDDFEALINDANQEFGNSCPGLPPRISSRAERDRAESLSEIGNALTVLQKIDDIESGFGNLSLDTDDPDGIQSTATQLSNELNLLRRNNTLHDQNDIREASESTSEALRDVREEREKVEDIIASCNR